MIVMMIVMMKVMMIVVIVMMMIVMMMMMMMMMIVMMMMMMMNHCAVHFTFFRLWMYNYFTVHSSGSNFNVLYHAVMFLPHKVRVSQEQVSVSD